MTMKISDEIRKWADDLDSDDIVCTTATLYTLADRIDKEMIELPKDADGKPIHVGDTVWGCRSGMKMAISDLRMTANGWSISTSRGYLTDAEVTHTRPDSWELIADELEAAKGWRDQNGEYNCIVSSVSTKMLGDWAARIRRLAQKEGDYGPF